MANENKYFKTPFAESGDRNEVPNVGVGGAVGYDNGFGSDYELPQGDVSRKRIERNLYNGIHHSMTKNLKQWQEGLYPTWIEDDGTTTLPTPPVAFSYPIGMIVNHAGQDWVSNEASNQEEPGTGTKWSTFNPDKNVRIEVTVADIASGDFTKIPSYFSVTDRGEAPFNLVSGGTFDGFGILDAGNGNTAVYVGDEIDLTSYGATEGPDVGANINAALLDSLDITWPNKTFESTIPVNQNSAAGNSIKGSGKRFGAQLNVLHDGDGLTLGDGGTVESVYIRRDVQYEGIGIISDSSDKWNTLSDMQVARHGIGIKLQNYYHNLENLIITDNGEGVRVGDDIGSSGAVNIKGTHFRDNVSGLVVYKNVNQVWAYGNTFEFNRYHLEVYEGSTLAIYGSYLGDPPETVLNNYGGKVRMDLGGFDQAVSGSTAHIDDLIIDNPYVNFPIFCIRSTLDAITEIANGVVGVNQQIREDQGTKTLVGAVFSAEGTYKLNNVRLYIGTGAANGSIYTNEITDKATILNYSPLQNYVNNGMFFDEAAATDVLYVANAGVTIAAGIRNPWGGPFLDIPASGIKIKYTIPARLVGKKLMLMFMAGENIGASNFGVRLDGINSDVDIIGSPTDLTNYPSLDIPNSIYRPFSYQMIPDGREFAAITRIEVTSATEEGQINFFVTGGNFRLGALILTEVDYDASNGFPYGFFEQLEPKLL